MSSRISFVIAVGLLLMAMALRLWNVTSLPPGYHTNELDDVRVIETIRTGRIEVFYELGGQPPREGLYHIAAAAVSALIGRGSLGFRILSIWASMFSLAIVYAVGSRLFGRLAGLSAMALLAVSFWPVLLARQVVPNTLLPLFVSLALLCLSLSLPVYRTRLGPGVNDGVNSEAHTAALASLGVFLGLGLYVHPACLLIALMSLIYIIYLVAFSRQGLSPRAVGYMGFALLVALIIAVPYLTSSLQRSGVSGMNRLFDDAAGVKLDDFLSSVLGIVANGDTNPAYNLPGRPLFDLVSGVLILIGIGACLVRWRKPRWALMLVALFTLSPIGFLTAGGSNFLALSPLLPVMALFFGLGVSRTIWTLRGREVPYSVIWSVLGGLVVLVLFNMGWTAHDLFTTWPDRPDVQETYHARLSQLAQYIDRTSTSVPTVVCGWQANQSFESEVYTPAQIISLLMNRDNAPVRYADCGSGLVMTNGGAFQQVILPDPLLLESTHPQIRDWLVLSEAADRQDIPSGTVLQMDVEPELANRVGQLIYTRPLTYAPEVGGEEVPIGSPVSFGNNLTFLGYVPEGTGSYRPGSYVTLVTFWRVDGPVPRDLRLFSHILLDPGARPAANTDTISVSPSELRNRDVFVQVTYILLPDSIPPGEYEISIGAYQDTSTIRLEVLRDNEPYGNRLFLYHIFIAG